MKTLRTIFTGWPALLTLLVAPTLAVLISPHEGGGWERWMFVAPWLAGYVWLTWPTDAAGTD